jgi:hypothetical protein
VIDLRTAVILADDNPGTRRAATMLSEEVQRRTQIRWPVEGSRRSVTGPAVQLIEASDGAHVAERYSIGSTAGEARDGFPTVVIRGDDARGVLFGVGRLLRLLRMERGRVELPEGIEITSAPRYPLRGHQLGYRPKTNSYDGWSLPVWEQYIRDLIVFGTNAVELIPPRSDDDADSPHFPLPPMEMMVGMSQILADYGLDVWIWYPAMDADYGDPATVAAALEEWGEVFRQLPRVDHVFVPGGDPGHTAPRHLMALLEKQCGVLRRHHPKAGMWVSPQGFDQVWLDEFLEILRHDRPAWMSGVVYGPQIRVTLPKLRAAVPEQYPIRRYPDITHSRHCQYPVPDWDPAFARTEGREGINPRPLDQARIFRLLADTAIGFITYSEGCNDDLNKLVWSALGWDPEADVVEILREYSRYFIGEGYRDGFAQGLLALERNWQGPLLVNEGVETTLTQFQAMEKAASPTVRANWRFQQALYRAYYDAYIRRRLIYETHLEQRALERLQQAEALGSLAAMHEAAAVLDRAVTKPVAQELRVRVFELAEALFQSIRMQLSVERHQAIAVERGANLDTIDVPLNNRAWLKQQFTEIGQLEEEMERLRAISEVVHWTDPGPGGFYDDLGNHGRQPHLVRGPGFEEDPSFRKSALMGVTVGKSGRVSGSSHVLNLYEAPLTMRYDGLDPSARYRLRVLYDLPGQKKVRLMVSQERELDTGELALRSWEIHPYIGRDETLEPLEFDLPAEAAAAGEMSLVWRGEADLGGNGRGCQVAEVWLMKGDGQEPPVVL